MQTTAIPSTSANACICRWPRNVPGPSPGGCNAFANVFEVHPRCLLAAGNGLSDYVCRLISAEAKRTRQECESVGSLEPYVRWSLLPITFACQGGHILLTNREVFDGRPIGTTVLNHFLTSHEGKRI